MTDERARELVLQHRETCTERECGLCVLIEEHMQIRAQAAVGADLTKLRTMSEHATEGTWYTVEAPWRIPDQPTYAVAGSRDPHIGTVVLDTLGVDEWTDEGSYDETFDGQLYRQDADLAFAVACVNFVRGLLAQEDAA